MDLNDTVFQTWGQAFDAFLDNLLNNGIPTLEAGLASAAEKLNGFSAKLLEMFNFPGVLDKVKQVGANLAAAFNSLIASIDWNQLGQAVGAGLNTAIAFAVSFLYSVDWAGLGSSLAELLNGIVSQIDWNNFGMLLFAGFKIGIEALAGFILGADMVELAHAASEVAIGFFDAMTETIKNVDWQEIGHQVSEFLANVDWGSVATSTFTAIGAAFGALTTFLWGLIEDAWDEIVDWWYESAYEDGQFTVKGLMSGIADAFTNIFDWLVEHVGEPLVDGFDAVFGSDDPEKGGRGSGRRMAQAVGTGVEDSESDLNEAGRDMVRGVEDGAEEEMSSVWGWLKDQVVDPIVEDYKALFGIHSPSTVMAEQGVYIMQGLMNGVSSMVASVISVFSGLWESIKDVFSHITDWFKDKFSAAWQVVKDVFSSGGKIFDGIKDGILEGLKAVINSLITGINKVIAVPFNGINTALKKIRDIKILGLSPFSFISTISVPQIPKLAEGAVIPPNREFLAVLGDQRSGTNIETPLATMVEAFKQAMEESDSGGTYTFVVNLDGREVARNTIRHMNDMTRERGRSVVLV